MPVGNNEGANYQQQNGHGRSSTLCDSGSQLNLITVDCVQRLNLTFTNAGIHIAGVGDGEAMRAKGFLDVELTGVKTVGPSIAVRLVVVTKITSVMPVSEQIKQFVDTIGNSELADPEYWLPGRVDMLLGIGFWNEVVVSGLLREKVGNVSALAQKTYFGWVITTHHRHSSQIKGRSLHASVSDEPTHQLLLELNDNIKRFWELETLPEVQAMKNEDKLAEEIFTTTHYRDEAGRYVVQLPFKPGGPILGNSRRTALKQFLNLEKRIKDNPVAKKFLQDFFEDYLKCGHMQRAPPPPADDSRTYYAPYHMLMGRKPRVVFNCSCKSDSGVSLNDLQLAGARLQDDLQMIFMRLRLHKYGLVADVEKMFRMIGVHRDDWDY